MSDGFERRQDGFETKYKLQEEQKFRASARRNKLLGQWAGKRMGLADADLDAYVMEVVRSDFEEAGDDDVFRKVKGDFETKGHPIADEELRETMDRLYEEACRTIAEEG